jgi:hypothetical protein
MPTNTITAMRIWGNIVNTGNESADDVYIFFTSNAYELFRNALPHPWLVPGACWQVIDPMPTKFMVRANIPLHRDFQIKFMNSYEWKGAQRSLASGKRLQTFIGQGRDIIYPQFDDITINIDVYSKNASLKAYAICFSQEDLFDKNECIKICNPLNY